MAEPNYELVRNDDIHLSSEKFPKKKGIKNIASGILMGMAWIYFISVVFVFVPYYNWQFAKTNGFLKWVIFGEIVPTGKAIVWPYFVFFSHSASSFQARGEVTPVEYVDNEYGFAFQYPSDWKMVPPPPKGDFGEARIAIHSSQLIDILVTIGNLDRPTVSRDTFLNNLNSTALVDSLINFTIESVYKKTSRDIGASRMIVAEKHPLPSNVAIKFYINTANFTKTEKGELLTLVSGIHCLPFDKSYLISFIMTSPIDPAAKEVGEALDNVFNSFHLIGETPFKKDALITVRDKECIKQ